MLVDRASGLKKYLCQTFNQPKSETSHYSSYSYYFCICRKRYRTYQLTTRSRYQEQGKVITSHGIAITCHCRWYSLLTHKDTILSSTRQWLWNAKAEKIQDIENHTKTTVLNRENNIFNPRLLYITARNSIHVQDVVNTCVKMEINMQE